MQSHCLGWEHHEDLEREEGKEEGRVERSGKSSSKEQRSTGKECDHPQERQGRMRLTS